MIDKTIQPKKPIQELQSEPVGEEEVSDKPHVPRIDVIDGEPEQDKATHTPPAPYPHRLRAPKKVNNYSEIYDDKTRPGNPPRIPRVVSPSEVPLYNP